MKLLLLRLFLLKPWQVAPLIAVKRLMGLFPILLSLLAASATVSAQSSECTTGIALTQTFDSGASWSLCATVDKHHGLQIDDAHYRAPGDFQRQVLRTLHLSQILLHYHDASLPEAQINPLNGESASANDPFNVIMTEQNCAGETLSARAQSTEEQLCVRLENNGILAKYSQRPSLHSQRWELSSAFERDSLTWTVSIGFTEDGQIIPAVTLSGRAAKTGSDARYAQDLTPFNRSLVRATLLSTWRMVFDLDTDARDRVEQFEFPLKVDQGNRRPLEVSAIETETLRNVHREHFRGWRIMDISGAGYYLDPANSGFAYRNGSMNWAQFDLAVTRFNPCERHALNNPATVDSVDDDSAIESAPCGKNLDNFVDGESLQDATPVLWYSQTRSFRPSQEDWPVISNVHLSFNLMPFDWTSSSPFELSTQ
ncbi:MAG: hypothetical protein AB8B79_03285 [Granulosicoccus sp.]